VSNINKSKILISADFEAAKNSEVSKKAAQEELSLTTGLIEDKSVL